MKFLITGGAGFLGSNLAVEVLKRGHELYVFDNLFKDGCTSNLKWIKSHGNFRFIHSDIRSYNDVESAVKESSPDVIFHLAGQVAMTTSLANPRLDFEINVLGGNNLLEAVRKYAPDAIVTYSSTNKVYGDFDSINFKETDLRYIAEGYENGFDESVPLNFQSPYGCSKGATDQYMLDYNKMFGIKTIVFRHSSIFGGRQFSTFDQGWIGWFVKQAIDLKNKKIKNFTIAGNGKQVRDVLFADDLIKCYFSAIEKPSAFGQSFNIGGGVSNSLSLLELFRFLSEELKVKMEYEMLPWRISDQKVFIADTTKAKNIFQWQPALSKETALKEMIRWVQQIN